MRQEDHDYHVHRARAELDRAAVAARPEAAEAHRRLSYLHLKWLQRADEDCEGDAGFRGR